MSIVTPIPLPYDLRFQHVPHGYALNGNHVPSVTQILDHANLVTGKAFFRPEHARRGTIVHEATHYYDEGDLGTLDPEYHGYLESYIVWREATNFQPRLIECRLASLRHQFAGTLDRTGPMGGIETMIDIKTGDYQRWHDCQLEGYKILLEENRVLLRAPPIQQSFILKLEKDGTIAKLLPPKTDPRIARSVFMSALTCIQFNGVSNHADPAANEFD